MSSGIEFKLAAIHQPDYYTLFFFPRSMWTRFWAQNAIPHQTSTRMTHLKVYMIIISCRDCTLHFNVFITTYMGALVRLWKGGKHLSSWEGQKWQCGSHLFALEQQSLGNLSWKFKSWMSKRVHLRPQFLKLAKIISAMRESIDTDLMNRVAFT